MNPNKFKKKSAAAALFMLGAFSLNLDAAPLDDVSLQSRGDVEVATIKLTGAVRYLRHFPAKRSKYLEIYYDRAGVNASDEPWLDFEKRQSPRSASTPGFTVTTRDQNSQPKLVIEFDREADFTVTPGADGSSFVLSIRADKAPQSVAAGKGALPYLPAIAAPLAPADGNEETNYNKQGYDLMLAGREALSRKEFETATQLFNKLLLLPPNQYTQDAQEWVGVSRERAGQTAKAKVEYELYLKLYTEGASVAAVRQRLAGLVSPVSTGRVPVQEKKQADRWMTQGSITSRYYYGLSDIQTNPNATTTTWLPSSLSLVDTSFLNTYVDASERFISEEYDARVVFRDIWTQNFLAKQASRNRVNAAYFDLKNRQVDYAGRIGRQTASGGGVMGRFDGVTASYGNPQDFKATGSIGQLVDFVSVNQPVFYGANVDKGPASLYLINQTIEGVVDRRALGGDLKYFDSKMTGYALADYDVYFRSIGNLLATGTLTLDSGTSFNAMGNYSNLTTTRNALIGSTTTSVKDLLASLASEEELRQLAIKRTMKFAFGQVGVAQKVHENWQIGGDLRVAKSSGFVASGVDNTLQGLLLPMPGTGWEYTGTGQLIGRNLFTAADITSFGASYIKSDLVSSGQSLFVYNHTVYDKRLSFDTSWRYYRQNYAAGGDVSGNMPTLRVLYQVQDKLSLDLDAGFEMLSQNGSYQTTATTRRFFSGGFRWDF